MVTPFGSPAPIFRVGNLAASLAYCTDEDVP